MHPKDFRSLFERMSQKNIGEGELSNPFGAIDQLQKEIISFQKADAKELSRENVFM